MDDRLAIQLNHEIQELIQSSRWRDTDNFGIRLSRDLALRLSASRSLPASLSNALAETRTIFFRANRLQRRHFEKQLTARLRALGIQGEEDLYSSIRGFCSFAERQLAHELWSNRNDEGVLRSHLQTFLEARRGGTLKEVVTGRGRADIALLDRASKGVIETKLWKGEKYFGEGLLELAEYLRTEDLAEGYYVVLDCSSGSNLVQEKGQNWTEHIDDRDIHVLFIRVSPSPPSKLRRRRS